MWVTDRLTCFLDFLVDSGILFAEATYQFKAKNRINNSDP